MPVVLTNVRIFRKCLMPEKVMMSMLEDIVVFVMRYANFSFPEICIVLETK